MIKLTSGKYLQIPSLSITLFIYLFCAAGIRTRVLPSMVIGDANHSANPSPVQIFIYLRITARWQLSF